MSTGKNREATHSFAAAIVVLAMVLLSSTDTCHSQGTLQITFDEPTSQPPGTAFIVQRYDESGMSFTPIGTVGFVRSGGGRDIFADNGTTYLQAFLGSTLQFGFTNGSLYGLVSVDLAEFSVTVTDIPVTFVGYRQDGSMVTTDFITDGIIDGTGPLADFQTFYFDKEWADLTRVEIPTYGWSLDNLVVSQIPEPASGTLLLAGGLLLWRLRHIRSFQNRSR